MTIGLQRIEEKSWEVTMSDGTNYKNQAHGLGFAPDAAKISIKPKDGTDTAGDTITCTTGATNIQIRAVNGPVGEDWVFEVQYVEGL